MHENLLGYLLGALDADEHETLQRQIQDNPELRHKLCELESRLAPLEAHRWQQFEPPSRLATSTCRLVATQDVSRQTKPRFQSGSSTAFDPPRGGVSWSLMDMVVAAGIFVAISCLFLPAIANSRYQAQMMACQNNLHSLFGGLSSYSQANNGVFPSPLAQANVAMAGIFAPRLVDPGFVSDPKLLFCPTDQSRHSADYRLPSAADLEQAPQEHKLWAALREVYGYNVGYVDENNRYQQPRDRRRAHIALLADRPTVTPNGIMINGHHGRGMNVLLEDGHVQLLPAGVCNIGDDDIFRNDEGIFAPGTHEDDAVISSAVRRVVVSITFRFRAPAGSRIRVRTSTPGTRKRSPEALTPESKAYDLQKEL